MTGKRKAKPGRVLAYNKSFELNFELLEKVRQENKRREIERKMQEEDNKRLMYVDPLDQRFSL